MKALALVESIDHVCCRYRIGAFVGAMADAGWSVDLEPLAKGPLGRLAQFRRSTAFDAVILQRKLLPGWQVARLRRHAKRLIFDFDDAVFHRDSNDPRGQHHPRRLARFRRVVRLADRVIAGNRFLAEMALKAAASADRVRVIPTCVDTATSSTDRPARPPDAPLELAWIGSTSTLQGLDRNRPTWERIGREVPGVRLKIICDGFLRFDSLEVVERQWSRATEAADLAGADVGISWVPDDLWSRGKCGLKILQYQAACLPVLANPVGVHPELIREGVDGFLPDSADEWVASVARLAADRGLVARMGREARRNVEASHSVEAWSPRFVEAVAADHSRSVRPPQPIGRSPARSRPAALG